MLVYLQVIEWGLVVGGGGEGTASEIHVVGGAQDEHLCPVHVGDMASYVHTHITVCKILCSN